MEINSDLGAQIIKWCVIMGAVYEFFFRSRQKKKNEPEFMRENQQSSPLKSEKKALKKAPSNKPAKEAYLKVKKTVVEKRCDRVISRPSAREIFKYTLLLQRRKRHKRV